MPDIAMPIWLDAPESLRRRILYFNYHPVAWALPERLTEYGRFTFDFVSCRENGRAEAHLSRWLLRQWELASPYFFDFSAPENRLALLAPAVLDTLAEHVGLLSYTSYFRRCIKREERLAIAHLFGEERRAYVMSHGLLYEGWLPEGPMEEEMPNLASVRQLGWRRILGCISSRDEALWRRIELKLPSDAPTVSAEKGAVWPLVRRMIKREQPLEWDACCF